MKNWSEMVSDCSLSVSSTVNRNRFPILYYKNKSAISVIVWPISLLVSIYVDRRRSKMCTVIRVEKQSTFTNQSVNVCDEWLTFMYIYTIIIIIIIYTYVLMQKQHVHIIRIRITDRRMSSQKKHWLRQSSETRWRGETDKKKTF